MFCPCSDNDCSLRKEQRRESLVLQPTKWVRPREQHINVPIKTRIKRWSEISLTEEHMLRSPHFKLLKEIFFFFFLKQNSSRIKSSLLSFIFTQWHFFQPRLRQKMFFKLMQNFWLEIVAIVWIVALECAWWYKLRPLRSHRCRNTDLFAASSHEIQSQHSSAWGQRSKMGPLLDNIRRCRGLVLVKTREWPLSPSFSPWPGWERTGTGFKGQPTCSDYRFRHSLSKIPASAR